MSASPRKLLSNLEEAKRELASRSLREYAKQIFPLLEPGRTYVDNWHIGAICEHLEAATAGQIPRLLINVPPGSMKSLLCSVAWPTWEWGPKGLAHHRFVSASYSGHLSLRDARKSKVIITSRWFQERWGDQFSLLTTGDGHYINSLQGFRLATSPGGIGTGERGDRVVVDDPHNVRQGESEAIRESTVTWFKETLPTRVVDIANSAFVVIMQRVHERDVSGVILSEEMGYEHLNLPMRWEGKTCITVLGVQDPRTIDGELLDPVRYPDDKLTRLEKTMGAYAVAGQMQQRPAPRGGGMIKRAWFEVVDAAPASGRRIRSWDLAGSEAVQGSDPDWTVGLRMSKASNGIFYIEDVTRDRLSPLGVESLILNTATQDGRRVSITVPQDPGQAGKGQASQMILKLATFVAKSVIPSGDKWTRAKAFAAQAEAGNVKLVRGSWNEAFLTECASFPTGAHDDQIDAAADAFNELVLGDSFDPDTFLKANQ